MRTVIPISEISADTKQWTAKVTLQEMMHPAQGKNTPTRYRKMIFTDSQGTRVLGILFNSEIETMSSKLEVYKTYLISNAEVKPIPKAFQMDGIDTQWIIGSRTVVEEVSADCDACNFHYDLTPFRDFSQFVDHKDRTIDVMGAVIDYFPIRQVKKDFANSTLQKFVIINEEMQPVVLAVWNNFVEKEGREIISSLSSYPVVVCRRLKVVSVGGISLSTRADSVILVCPPVKEAKQLRNWVSRNTKTFKEIVKNKAYNKFSPQASYKASQQHLTKVIDLQPALKFAWTKVSISFQHIVQKYWYMGCKKCYKLTAASYGLVFTCNHCDERQAAEPRCRFDVDLSDDTGTVTASIFGDEAEKLLTFSAMQAMEYSDQNFELPLSEVHEELKSKVFIAQLKPSKSKYTDLQDRYTIVCYFEHSGEDSSFLECAGSSSIASQLQNTDAMIADGHSVKARVCLASKFDASGKAHVIETEELITNSPKRLKTSSDASDA